MRFNDFLNIVNVRIMGKSDKSHLQINTYEQYPIKTEHDIIAHAMIGTIISRNFPRQLPIMTNCYTLPPHREGITFAISAQKSLMIF